MPVAIPQSASDAAQPSQEDPSSMSDRALAVLDYVTQSSEPPGLMEIANALHFPKATASRLCSGLESRQWLTRHEGDRSFAPGPRLLSLAVKALQCDPRQALRHEVLSQLVQALGETCNLTVLDGTRVRYLDRVETHWPLRMQLEVGSLVPLHATASGKLFLAHMADQRRQAVLENLLLTPCTSRTLQSAEALAQQVQQIQALGYACDREEFMLGMIAVAVPIKDDKGLCRAALAVHAPQARMSLEQALMGLPHLQAAAQRMGKLLF
ncbi:IclR family transcriptional regulator [Comamonas thiooxydans]|nr:IclR family transcriptional regulator [Comamonas thiooxydans]